ncbi:UPF0280 family protein [Thiovibrio frasassiensis]|uniref:UPF0280 family protein n=1 Tax=Thiovibrio frasassiensis TaxID=2984131 RepID=A0A9X4RLL7_9BACT|nr:UPF0280 family protein [Thiovibrio frasassiensis]MDG4475283.1 UPF0280 family protein [Thiovibrio frasassiensis]
MTVKRKKKTPDPSSYRKRTYRNRVDHGALVSFEVRIRETDLQILAGKDLRDTAGAAVFQYRSQLESYIARHPEFATVLTPLPGDPTAPPIVKSMLGAGLAAEVGPMAAVAGAIAEYVGRDLLAAGAGEVVVENGGDIFFCRNRESVVGIFAGASPLSNRVGLKIPARCMPLGICTSSGTVGHSLSLGEADAVTVLAKDTALADAVATLVGNAVQPGQSLDAALAKGAAIPGVLGVVIIRGEELGAWGEVELVPL